MNYGLHGMGRGKYAASYAKYGIPLTRRSSRAPFTFCIAFQPQAALAPRAEAYDHTAFLAQMTPVSFRRTDAARG